MLKIFKLLLLILWSFILIFLIFLSFFNSKTNDDIKTSINLDYSNKTQSFYLSWAILYDYEENKLVKSWTWGNSLDKQNLKLYYKDNITDIDFIYYNNKNSFEIEKNTKQTILKLKTWIFFLNINDISNNVLVKLPKLENDKTEEINKNLSLNSAWNIFLVIKENYIKILSINSSVKIDFNYIQWNENFINTYYLFPHDYFLYKSWFDFKNNNFARLNQLFWKYLWWKIKDINEVSINFIKDDDFAFLKASINYISKEYNNVDNNNSLLSIGKINNNLEKQLESWFISFFTKININFLFNKEKLISYNKIKTMNSIIDLYNLSPDLAINDRTKHLMELYKNMQDLKSLDKETYEYLYKIFYYYYKNINIKEILNTYKRENFLNAYLYLNDKSKIWQWEEISIYLKLSNIFFNYDFLENKDISLAYNNFISDFIEYYWNNRAKINNLWEKYYPILNEKIENIVFFKEKVNTSNIIKDEYINFKDNIYLWEALLNNIFKYSQFYSLKLDSNNIWNDIDLLWLYFNLNKIVYFSNFSSNNLKNIWTSKNIYILNMIKNYIIWCYIDKKTNNEICKWNIFKQEDKETCLQTINTNIKFSYNNINKINTILDWFKKIFNENKDLDIFLNKEKQKANEELLEDLSIYLFAISDNSWYEKKYCIPKSNLWLTKTPQTINNEDGSYIQEIYNLLIAYNWVKIDLKDISKKDEKEFLVSNFEIKNSEQKLVLSFSINKKYNINNIKLISNSNKSWKIEEILSYKPSYKLNIINELEEKPSINPEAPKKENNEKDFFIKTFIYSWEIPELTSANKKDINIFKSDYDKSICDKSDLSLRLINDNFVWKKWLFYKYKSILNVKLDDICIVLWKDKNISKRSINYSDFYISPNLTAKLSWNFIIKANRIIFLENPWIKLVFVEKTPDNIYLKKLSWISIDIIENIYLDKLQDKLKHLSDNFASIETVFNSLESRWWENISIKSYWQEINLFANINNKNISINIKWNKIINMIINWEEKINWNVLDIDELENFLN